MKNSADLGGCYLKRPKAEVDNTLPDLLNSSYPTQPHSLIAKYIYSDACTKNLSTTKLIRENILGFRGGVHTYRPDTVPDYRTCWALM